MHRIALPRRGSTTQPRVAVAHPGKRGGAEDFYPEGVAQALPVLCKTPSGYGCMGPRFIPGCAIATLGCAVKPLRGNDLVLRAALTELGSTE